MSSEYLTGEFSALLQTALSHLYDYPYLASHPMAAMLMLHGDSRIRARDFSQFLIESVERLRPSEDVPRSSRAWRNYAYLSRRYVHLATVAEVARELAVSERQSQRIHTEALEALAMLIKARCPGGKVVPAREGEQLPPPDSQLSAAGADGEGTWAIVSEVMPSAAVPTFRRTHLPETLDSVLSTIRVMAEERGATACVDVPRTGIPEVDLDRAFVRQAVLSLLVACLNSGARRILLSARVVAENVELRVAIDERVDRGAEREAPTHTSWMTALERHHSFVTATQLLKTQGIPVEVRKSLPDSAVIITFPTARRCTVLLVDDNLDTLRLFSRYLSASPYQAVAATSGAQALQLAREVHPAIVILDVMMPSQDGWETLQTLRNDLSIREIPVVVCSIIDELELALSLGAAGVLVKPVSRAQLLSAVESCLGNPEAR